MITRAESEPIVIKSTRLYSTDKNQKLSPESPVKALAGVGDVLGGLLAKQGINTIAELAALGDSSKREHEVFTTLETQNPRWKRYKFQELVKKAKGVLPSFPPSNTDFPSHSSTLQPISFSSNMPLTDSDLFHPAFEYFEPAEVQPPEAKRHKPNAPAETISQPFTLPLQQYTVQPELQQTQPTQHQPLPTQAHSDPLTCAHHRHTPLTLYCIKCDERTCKDCFFEKDLHRNCFLSSSNELAVVKTNVLTTQVAEALEQNNQNAPRIDMNIFTSLSEAVQLAKAREMQDALAFEQTRAEYEAGEDGDFKAMTRLVQSRQQWRQSQANVRSTAEELMRYLAGVQ
eukprot:c10874_g1_i2.p1 GENE.c10874_g1_i2~~c10874_g1_i2.p1  ORF type:complete len:343 (+),score=85.78 c10874_g1_i2:428-1456(+)